MIKKETAKEKLDKIINKARIHLYKPIQIAEILYHNRMNPALDLSILESYRSESKKWRDNICKDLLGSVCTSSCRFQDNLFDDNAIPPDVLVCLGKENRDSCGAVEAYIYNRFANRYSLMQKVMDYCLERSKKNFQVSELISLFWKEAGLKRSLDKIYEIIVYSLFITIIDALDLKISLTINRNKINILEEFSDFTKSVMQIDLNNPEFSTKAKVFRVGVTNAADRGLDMYSNWGPAIQIKHLTLDEELAESIVDSVSSDRIIIVCKNAERKLLVSVLTQIGWKSKIQSIITEENLIDWYEKALRGKYSVQMGDSLLTIIRTEIENEFPSVGSIPTELKNRHYENITNAFWKI